LIWGNSEDWIAQCGTIATLLEVSGFPKPGNVHRTQNFENTRYEDFLISGVAIYPTLRKIASRGKAVQQGQLTIQEIQIGQAILEAVEATQSWQKGGNTNLGIILLLLPLACVAGMVLSEPFHTIAHFRELLHRIVVNSTPSDTIYLFKAIQLANPGGLGKVKQFDVNSTTPEELIAQNISLFDIFKLSASLDSIAREWITQFQITFEIGYPFFIDTFQQTRDFNISTVHTYLKILSTIPDTLITRKYNIKLAKHIQTKAKLILKKGGLLTQQSKELLWQFDHELRNEKKLNPGTSADLTAASIMVALLSGIKPY